jgi:hypothetical protein
MKRNLLTKVNLNPKANKNPPSNQFHYTYKVCSDRSKQSQILAILKALYPKYSESQNHYHLTLTNAILKS